MPAFTSYLQSAVLNHVFGATAFTKPTSLYVALYTVAPNFSGGGTEVTGGSYSRRTATFDPASVNGGSSVAANSAALVWPAATANWGTLTAVGIFDAVTGGNLLAYGLLQVQKTITTGDIFTIPDSGLTISLS
ncbi:hypothetical protein [Bordetella flabilis]|uniref:Phage tail protein n=1 Tax=Bordetella flabilis TaxID=463014 RepID=A0A193GB07_9BORD|nr:hypothetical protein [Bordetella flabilis]ANN76808.1 hypothetical protein BAU07_06490 [Bordetella flabilis]